MIEIIDSFYNINIQKQNSDFYVESVDNGFNILISENINYKIYLGLCNYVLRIAYDSQEQRIEESCVLDGVLTNNSGILDGTLSNNQIEIIFINVDTNQNGNIGA